MTSLAVNFGSLKDSDFISRGEIITTVGEFKERLEKSRKFPGTIHIDITNHCDRKCNMCFMKDRYSKNIFPLGFIDMNLYRKIIVEGANEYPGQWEVHLYKDGEPLLHPQLKEMIEFAKRYNMFIHLATNGLKLYDRRFDVAKLDRLTVSMSDGLASESVTKYLEWRKDNDGPYTQIKVFNESSYQAEEFKDEVRVFQTKVFHADGWLKEKSRIYNNVCHHLVYNPAITWDGNFLMCCTDWKRTGYIGNVKRDSIKSLWKICQFLAVQQTKGVYIPPCSSCTKFDELGRHRAKPRLTRPV